MTIFAMVTTQRSSQYTDFALRTFFSHTPITSTDRFVLIDNDGGYSTPILTGTVRVELVTNPQPISFAANVNQALAWAVAARDSLVFLNNDVIFTPNWYDGFASPIDVLLVPYSNREFQYKLPLPDGEFSLPIRMSLEDYRGNAHLVDQVAFQHQRRFESTAPFLPVLCAPFFVVKIPFAIIEAIGAFDTRYGIGGGEDYDYALRAHYQGYSVAYVQKSYLLHFGSQSIPAPDAPEPEFVRIFRDKWGAQLTALAFAEDPDIDRRLGLRNYDYQRLGFQSVIQEALAGREIRTRLDL